MINNKEYNEPINTKLENKDLDVLNKNILILIKQNNKLNKHLSRIDYDIGQIKREVSKNEK